MTKSNKRLLVVAGAIAATLVIAWTLAIGAAWAWAAHSGVVTVNIHDHREGLHLWVPVPMALVDVALSATAVPAVHTAGLGHFTVDGVTVGLGEIGPMVVELMEAIESMPDATLVEVRDRGDHVRVVKSGNKLLVHVEEPHASVSISIPARAVARIADRLLG
jgi:hypothetical protein